MQTLDNSTQDQTQEITALSSDDVYELLFRNNLLTSSVQWDLIKKWETLIGQINQQINLISRKDWNSIWEKQVLHCLSLLSVWKTTPGMEICDFGSGGGLPGVLLAIVCPDLKITMIDATQKKVKVIRQLITDLGLTNAEMVAGRGEDLGKTPDYAQKFALIVCRAVSTLGNLELWTRDLRAPQSSLYVYKGGDLTQEMAELSQCRNLKFIKKYPLTLEGYSGFDEQEKVIVQLSFSNKKNKPRSLH
ncbi:MAG: 16S rRNA (guanine(527)-N(7))-methyltransferase RsmG [SAR324 cluster bacterium]|nr:16S rRNA (guanine(527)-N(7))-methyltransferase RsmG [SAR324 cluster bacterium]